MNREIDQPGRGMLLWRKRGTFVLAAAASAIGLGNIWRFPYELGENGGSAFLFVYLLCILIICVPVMIGEALIGRVGRSGPVQSYTDIAFRQRSGRWWVLLGLMGILTGFMISSFYSVVGGWATAYAWDALSFSPSGSLQEASDFFEQLTTSWPYEILMMTLFLLLSGAVVFQGVIAGLERFLRLVMPLLLVLLVVIMLYALAIGDDIAALSYIFKPDFSRLDGEVVLKAMGHAFFSLSLGMGVMVTFGSYTPSEQNLQHNVFAVALLDTMVAVLAGVMIFPLVFAVGLEPSAGPSLVFESLPHVFGQIPLGSVMRLAFFLLLVLAALSSMVSLIEPVVSAVEHRFGMLRRPSCALVIGALWVTGVGCALSWDLFDLMNFLTANVMLPLGGLLVALYVGWYLKPELYTDQKGVPAGNMYRLWLVLLRWVAPLAIAAILINGLYVSLFGG